MAKGHGKNTTYRATNLRGGVSKGVSGPPPPLGVGGFAPTWSKDSWREEHYVGESGVGVIQPPPPISQAL